MKPPLRDMISIASSTSPSKNLMPRICWKRPVSFSVSLSVIFASRWDQDCIAHTVNKFLVGGRYSGERAAQLDVISFDKEVGAKPDPALHCFQFARVSVPILMFNQPSLVKALQDGGRRFECGQRVFDPFLPVRVS